MSNSEETFKTMIELNDINNTLADQITRVMRRQDAYLKSVSNPWSKFRLWVLRRQLAKLHSQAAAHCLRTREFLRMLRAQKAAMQRSIEAAA